MGFFDVLKSLADHVMEQVRDFNGEVPEYKRQYSSYSDERLINEFKRSSGSKQVAIGLLLKERGYRVKERQ